jgi:uncharacterized protein
MRRIIIETGHPGQVHQFRHLAQALEKSGNKVLFVAKEKEMTRYLLERFNLEHVMLSAPRIGILGKILQLPMIYLRYALVILRFRPHFILSRFSLQSSHLACIFRIPHIGYTDTEHVRRLDSLTVPFVKTRISASTYQRDLGRRHYRFPGNTELFYLHPDRYQPNKDVLPLLGVAPGEPYAIFRFVSWKAHHDIGKRGLSTSMKETVAAMVSKRMKLFISSEDSLLPSLEQYRFSIPPELMHDALGFASLYLGEGGTMASEAAMLGTPAIYINPLMVGYVEDEAKHGLVISMRDEQTLPETLNKMLEDPELKTRQLLLRDEYLSEMIDPTAMYLALITRYPESFNTLKKGGTFAGLIHQNQP